MTTWMPFIVIGIATGSLYGLAAMGLVLTYKTSGIFNFAHGAIAAIAVYVYFDLTELRGLPWPIALVGAVVVAPPILGFVMERIARLLAPGTTTMKIVATVGLQLSITTALIAIYGPAQEFPAFLPIDAVELFGVFVGLDQLVSVLVGAGGALGFFLFFKFSAMGLRMRAVVDNPDLLSLTGSSPFVVRSWSWLIGTQFAAISGILLAPQIGLDALLLTMLVAQAYGAAAVGKFTSLPMAYAGGLLIGVLTSLATNFSGQSEVMSGLPTAVPSLVLFAVLLIAGKRLVGAGAAVSPPPVRPLLSTGASRIVAIAAVALAAIAPFVVGTKLPVFGLALVFVVIYASLHLLVRTSGQVSLAHAGLVAVGSAMFVRFAVEQGAPWLLAVLLAGLVAAPVGALVAIPSIRLSGLFLALATMGFGLVLEKMFYRTEFMFGANGSSPAPRPAGFEDDTAFYYVLLAFAVAAMVLVAVIRRSRLGRLLQAMADAPTTLSTLGLGVNVTRVTVFMVSAFMAGVGGALYASQTRSASGTLLVTFISLTWLALLMLCSPMGAAAPVVAALSLTAIPAYLDSPLLSNWLPALFGIGAIHVAALEVRAAKRGGHRQGGHAEARPSTSRAAERVGGHGPISERTTTAAAVAANGTSQNQPAMVRIGGVSTRPGSGVR
jgi:branched-subunit amino acid ABC-type transport system permease component